MDPNILQNLRKREGTSAGLQGFLYEIQIILLFMIRACLNNVKFKLVNNADGFGNFDDLVSKCKLEDGTELLVCLQSKHLKESENKIDLNRLKGKKYIHGKEKYTNDKSFDLQKYREEMLKSKISIYKDINVKFIFYTTVAISETDTDLQWCKIDNNDILCLLLDTSAGNNCVRRFSDTGNEQILSEMANDKKILAKICIFSNQCHESEFDKVIKNELKELLDTKNEDIINKIYSQLKEILVEWYKTMETFDNNKFLDMVWNFLAKEMSRFSSKGKSYKKLSEKYNHDKIKLLQKYIEENQIVIVNTDFNSTVLPAIDVYKAVSDSTHEFVKKRIFVKFKKLGKVLKLFKNIIDLLIIEVDCVDNFDLEMLFKILRKKKWKKVVFIRPYSIKFDIPLQNVNVWKYEYKFDFDSLGTDTQNHILSCNILFQGNIMPLSELFDKKDACSVLNYETVEKIISNETVYIGEELKKLPIEIEHCYIQRSFHCRNVVSSEIFNMKSNSDVLLVSVESEDDLHKYKRDFVHYKNLDENNANSVIFFHRLHSDKRDENLFKNFAAKVQEKNFHWLQERKNRLVWLGTIGSVKNIQQYFQTFSFNEGLVQQQRVSRELLLASDNKLNVLLDSAGKGKTITLYKIAEQLKLNIKNSWVLYYDLNSPQMLDILFEMSENEQSEEMDANQLVEKYFLTNCTLLEISVFNLLLEKSKIYFCFDGLDEISPRYENIFIAIVKKLNQSNTKQIWLTSREHMEKLLQDNFPVFPIKLLDISVEDRINFCVKYYTFNLNNGKTEKETEEQNKKQKLKQFSEALIESLLSVNDTILEFMGIPLLTKMLASINVEQCRKYLNNTHEEANLPMTFDNIFDLYQSFFENAIKRYLTEKESKDLKDPRLFLKEEIKKYQKLHMSIATRSLLPEHYSKLITEQGEPDKLTSDLEVCTKLLGIGIITSLEKPNAKFLHFTFAEFMLANLLLVNLENIQNHSDLKIILDEVLHNDRWKVVRKFLNSSTLLAENLSKIKYNPTAMNIPDEEETSLKIALREGNRNIAQCLLQCLRGVNEADAKTWICKQTTKYDKPALYIAIDNGYKEEVSLLVDLGVNVEEEMYIFDTPMLYAIKEKNLEIISLLLARGANIHYRDKFNRTKILEVARRSTPEVLDFLLAQGASLEDKDEFNRSLLMYAAQNKRNEMLVHVLGKVKCDVNYKDLLGDTALHRAANYAQSLNTKTLLDLGADINSQNNDGETTLHLLLQSLWFQEGSTQQQLCAKYLIKRGARTDITNNEGKTALESLNLTRSELNDSREWIEKHSEHVSIHDLEQQMKNSKY